MLQLHQGVQNAKKKKTFTVYWLVFWEQLAINYQAYLCKCF